MLAFQKKCVIKIFRGAKKGPFFYNDYSPTGRFDFIAQHIISRKAEANHFPGSSLFLNRDFVTSFRQADL